MRGHACCSREYPAGKPFPFVVHTAGASSTDVDRLIRGKPLPGWLDHMKLLRRITQQAKGIRAILDEGMTTAEYAVGTVAAVAFAAVLYKVVRSAAVQSALSSIISSALHSL